MSNILDVYLKKSDVNLIFGHFKLVCYGAIRDVYFKATDVNLTRCFMGLAQIFNMAAESPEN